MIPEFDAPTLGAQNETRWVGSGGLGGVGEERMVTATVW